MSIQSEKLMTLAGGEALYNDLRNRVDDRAPIIIDSKSGNPVAISDGVPGLKLYDAKVSFAPRQEGSGDPSPTNIRPIIGLTGINIYRSGKNLVQFSNQQGPSGAFYNGYSGWLTNGSWRIPDASIKYTYSVYIDNRNASESSRAKIWFFGADGTTSAGIVEGTQITAGAEGWSIVSFGNNANLYFAAFGLGLQAGGIATKGMVEIGESRTDYEPYSGTTIPISWQTKAGTVYGGSLDVLTGVLTVTHKIIDLTSISSNLWAKSTSYPGGFYCNIQTGSLGIKEQADFICSHAKTAHTLSEYENGTCYCDGSANIRIMPSGSELTDWQTYLSEQSNNGTPVCICAELIESYTIQLDPVTSLTLIDTNTIWTDADTVEITYPIDTKKYIDAGSSDVKDVQINGSSIVNNNVANIPTANQTTYGVVQVSSSNTTFGVILDQGLLKTSPAGTANIKSGNASRMPVVPAHQHESVYYGLSKAAGVDLASGSDTVGVYSPESKAAIQTMLGVENGVTFIEEKSGSSVTINGEPNVKYECGEVSTITITAPVHGTIDVWFMTGNTPAMLTTSGVTFPSWFDPEDLEPNTTYELVITDGYGGVTTWERPVSV